jgi:hypothetical protein
MFHPFSWINKRYEKEITRIDIFPLCDQLIVSFAVTILIRKKVGKREQRELNDCGGAWLGSKIPYEFGGKAFEAEIWYRGDISSR